MEDFVARLRRLDCCSISDALDRLGLSGQVTGLPQLSGKGRIAGRAVTVRLGTGKPPEGPPRHLGTTAIESGNADSVIVVEQRSGVEAGSWGGLLTLGALARGIAGTISDGLVRDVDEAIDLGYPVFARGTTCLTARGRVAEMETGGPITVGQVRVAPGDYVVADRSAVIFIPETSIAAVLEQAETIAAKEATMAGAIRAGTPIGRVMGGDYEHMLKG